MTVKVLLGILCLAVFAGCAATPDEGKKPGVADVPKVSDDKKNEQEARLLKDIYHLLEKGKTSDASALLSQLARLNPTNPELRLAQAEIFLRQGLFPEAASLFSELVTKKQLLARSHQGVGLVRLQLGQTASAKTQFEKAVALDDQLWRSWNGLGYYYDSKKQWGKAEESYNRALKLRRDKPALYNNRGFSKLMQGRYEDAIADFKTALKLDPGVKVARMNIRLAQAWLGRYVEAIAGASKRELPLVLNNVGYIAMLKGELATAEAYFSRAMELSPSFNETASNNLQKLEAIKLQSGPRGKARKR